MQDCKVCPKCKENKPMTKYSKRRGMTKKDGTPYWSSHCNDCKNKSWRNKYKEKKRLELMEEFDLYKDTINPKFLVRGCVHYAGYRGEL